MVTLNSTWICYLWVYEADSTLLLYIKQKCGVKNCISNFFQCSQLNSKDTISFKSVQHTAPLTISKQQFLLLILWKSATKVRYFIKERIKNDRNTETAWLTNNNNNNNNNNKCLNCLRKCKYHSLLRGRPTNRWCNIPEF